MNNTIEINSHSFILKRTSTHGLFFICNADISATINNIDIAVQNCHSYVGGNYNLPDDTVWTAYETEEIWYIVDNYTEYDDYINELDEDQKPSCTESEFETNKQLYIDFITDCDVKIQELKEEFLSSHDLEDEWELETLLEKLTEEDYQEHCESLEDQIKCAKSK